MPHFEPDQILVLVGVAIVAFILGRATRGDVSGARTEREVADREQVENALAELSSDVQTEVDRLLTEHRKIEAIKIFREATGLGLKQSKDAVEVRQRSLGV